MHETASLSSMLILGLLGAGHCLGMCGGISAALGMAVDGNKKLLVLCAYNIGRIFSYAIAGLGVGLLSYWGSSYLALGPFLRSGAGLLLILMGFYIANWWKLLVWLERAGAKLWRHIQPLANAYLPVRSPGKAIIAGMIWGWLPCGLVYSALAYSATASNPIHAAAMMAAFGLGTAPAVLLGGAFAQTFNKLMQRYRLKQIMGTILILFGTWVLWGVWQHQVEAAAHSSAEQGHQQHSH